MSGTANFPQLLRDYRKAKGLTQKQLGARLGVSNWAVSNYEQGRNIPSREVADKLVTILKLEKESVPRGRIQAKRYDDPFTDEERRFAEEHHGCVYHYLNTRGLPQEDLYDVAVFGYLHAVKVWFARPDLHIYSFSTIAYNYMRSAVSSEIEKQKRRPEYIAVSLDDIIPSTDGLTYGDILCDPRDCVGI